MQNTTYKLWKLLGVSIDQLLLFKDHMKKDFTKVGQSITLLRRIKQFIPLSARIKFDKTFIMPQLEYCCTMWIQALNFHHFINYK